MLSGPVPRGAGVSRPWDGLYSEEELETRRRGGYGSRGGIGRRPAVLVIDVVRAFTGDEGDEHAASIAKFRQSCGPVAWRSMPYIQRLIAAGRAKGFPVIYTRATPLPPGLRGAQMRKNARAGRESTETLARGHEFPLEITPHAEDIIVEKTKPSAFFGTPLLGHLQALGIDHLLVAGTTTSGCVRATVYDAFSHGFGLTIVEECVFDRFPTSHAANLFDMDAKFADVRPLADVLTDLGLPTSSRLEVAAT
jgi:maleamate amidohydrolase